MPGAGAVSSLMFPGTSDTCPLNCKICGKAYRTRQGLLFHEQAKHHNVFRVYCPVCGKGFQQTSHMYGHLSVHTNTKSFHCRLCGASYAHKTSLQHHLRSGACPAGERGDSVGLGPPSPQHPDSPSQFGRLPEKAVFKPSMNTRRCSPTPSIASETCGANGIGNAQWPSTLNQTAVSRAGFSGNGVNDEGASMSPVSGGGDYNCQYSDVPNDRTNTACCNQESAHVTAVTISKCAERSLRMASSSHRSVYILPSHVASAAGNGSEDVSMASDSDIPDRVVLS